MYNKAVESHEEPDVEVDDSSPPEVTIQYDGKHGRIVMSGMNAAMVDAVAKILHRKKKVSVQVLPDGLVVSNGGLYISKITEERLIGYG